MTTAVLNLGNIALAPDRVVCGCETCRAANWAAAPLVDALSEFVQVGKVGWRDITLAQAWRLGRGPSS